MMYRSNFLLKMLSCCLAGVGLLVFSGCMKDSRNTVDVIPGSYALDKVQWLSAVPTRAGDVAVDVNLVDVDSLNVHGIVKVYVEGNGSTNQGTIRIELPLDYFVSRTFNLLSQWSPVQVPEYPVRYGKSWIVDVTYTVDHQGQVICEFDPALFEMFGAYLVDLKLDFDKKNEQLIFDLGTNFGKGLNPGFFTKLVNSLKCGEVRQFLEGIRALYMNPGSQELFNSLKLNLDDKQLQAYFQSIAGFLKEYFTKSGQDYESFFNAFFDKYLKEFNPSFANEDFGKYLTELFRQLERQYEDNYEDFFEDFFESLFNDSYYQGTVRIVLGKQK